MTKSSDSDESQSKQKLQLLKDLKKDKEFNEFIRMKLDSGELKDSDSLTLDQERKLTVEFNSWKSNGKPKLVMPKINVPEDRVMKVYRVKQMGKQFIYYVDMQNIPHGMHWEHEYAKAVNPETGQEEDDHKQIIKSTPVYETPYTKELGEELVKRAFNECENPTFYLKVGKKEKISVHDPSNFNGDFDELVNKHRIKQVI